MTDLSPWQALLQQLDEQRPATLLCCSHTAQNALQQWCEHHQCRFTQVREAGELEALGRFDCVIVADWLEHLSVTAGVQSVARLRNLHSHAIWLLSPGCTPQPSQQLLGLGFQRLYDFPSRQLECYGYNLDRYNRTREWNNPRFWANPENWGKYWW